MHTDSSSSAKPIYSAMSLTIVHTRTSAALAVRVCVGAIGTITGVKRASTSYLIELIECPHYCAHMSHTYVQQPANLNLFADRLRETIYERGRVAL